MIIMNLRSKVFIFWGGMDVLSIITYCFFSLMAGNIPIYSDVQEFLMNLSNLELDGWSLFFIQMLFLLDITLRFSLVYSAWLFLLAKNTSYIFIGFQEILRFCSFMCSLSFIPLVLRFFNGYPVYVGVGLFIFSECCKVGTLWWCRKPCNP